MGFDSIEPYLRYEGKGVILLCRTSNPGGADLQAQRLASGELLYEHIARLAAGAVEPHRPARRWWSAPPIPAEIERVRELAPTLPLLIPGIGAQGGDAAATVRAGWRGDSRSHLAPIIVSSSRAVLYAGSGDDFAAAARARQAALAARRANSAHAGRPVGASTGAIRPDHAAFAVPSPPLARRRLLAAPRHAARHARSRPRPGCCASPSARVMAAFRPLPFVDRRDRSPSRRACDGVGPALLGLGRLRVGAMTALVLLLLPRPRWRWRCALLDARWRPAVGFAVPLGRLWRAGSRACAAGGSLGAAPARAERARTALSRAAAHRRRLVLGAGPRIPLHLRRRSARPNDRGGCVAAGADRPHALGSRRDRHERGAARRAPRRSRGASPLQRPAGAPPRRRRPDPHPQRQRRAALRRQTACSTATGAWPATSPTRCAPSAR